MGENQPNYLARTVCDWKASFICRHRHSRCSSLPQYHFTLLLSRRPSDTLDCTFLWDPRDHDDCLSCYVIRTSNDDANMLSTPKIFMGIAPAQDDNRATLIPASFDPDFTVNGLDSAAAAVQTHAYTHGLVTRRCWNEFDIPNDRDRRRTR